MYFALVSMDNADDSQDSSTFYCETPCIVHVRNDNGGPPRRTTAIPLSADTAGQDLLDCVRDPGYRMVHLVARWQQKEFLVLPTDNIQTLLQEFQDAIEQEKQEKREKDLEEADSCRHITEEVEFIVRYEETDTANAFEADCDSGGRRSQLRRGSTPTREISSPQWPQSLPGGGADLTLAELQGLAARQQVAMETQQQALVARETRLKYLQQQEARHRQLASEQARLQRMRERVEAQELKLKKLRALRGQVEQHKASNGNLNSELEAVRAVFNEKEKELAMAVSKVDQLMRQLQELKEVKANGVITNGNHVKGDPSVVALELDKLRNELLHRNKLNDQQNSRLIAQRQLLQQRKEEVSSMDNRIYELQQRLKKRRSQQQQQQNQHQLQPSSNSAESAQKNFNNNSSTRPGHNIVPRKPGQNIAAVEPYIQYAPKDVAKDDSYSKTGFLKQDPKYQTLPANTKFIPGPSAGDEVGGLNKPGGGTGGQQQVGEVNNNNTTTVTNNKSGSSSGVKPVEYKIPSLISSHFDANRGRGSNLGNRTAVENQGKGGLAATTLSAGAGAGAPSLATKPMPPTPTSQQPPSSSSSTVSGSKPNSTAAPPQQPVNSTSTTVNTSSSNNNNGKGSRPFVNTFGKSPGLPKWPPQPKDNDEDQQQQQPASQQQPGQQQQQQPSHHQPQINIFDEERQAGSGQSSPASSEGSGPLVKQGSGVFSHHSQPPSSRAQTHPGSGTARPPATTTAAAATTGQPDQAGQHAPTVPAPAPPPLEPRGAFGGRQGPKPPPRMPQGQASTATSAPSSAAGAQQTASANAPSANRAPNSRTGSLGSAAVGDDDVDSSRLSANDSVNPGLPQAQSTPQQGSGDGAAGTGGIHLNQRPAPTYRYASKSVIANTYMGRLGGAAMERYQQLNKQIYNTSHNAQGGKQASGATTSTVTTTTISQGSQPAQSGTASEKPTLAGELRTAFSMNQQSPISSSDPPTGMAGPEAGGQGGVTHFGLVGSPNYPDIASDKGSFKSNTPKHLRRRHSDSDNEELGKVLHRGDKPHHLENVAEDNNNNNDSNIHNVTASSEGKPQNGSAAQRLGKENGGSGGAGGGEANNDHASNKSSKHKEEKKAAVVTRRKKTILKGENRRKSMNRVSFDPLALLLDASLEGELELVMRTAKEVDDVSAPNDEGITALHNAICAGHYDIVKFLLEFGADVNSPDSDGWTPLHCAASCNNLPMVRFLIEHGACIFATTISDNETAAEKCEEDEDGYDGCSDYLYSVQEKLGIVNDGTVYAVFDYTAENNDELSFRINDKMTVLRKGDETEKEWWWTRMIGTGDGYIPRNLLGLYPRVPLSTYQPHQTSKC